MTVVVCRDYMAKRLKHHSLSFLHESFKVLYLSLTLCSGSVHLVAFMASINPLVFLALFIIIDKFISTLGMSLMSVLQRVIVWLRLLINFE